MKEGADINCLVLDNKLEEENKYHEGKEFQLNNFLHLSLKNSLIKGLVQKPINPYYKRNNCLIEESFETNITLGKYEINFLIIGINFLTNNFKNFNDENLVMENYFNNPNFIENVDECYSRFIPYKNNKISGFDYEK